ncbi:hypothetical protein A1OE_1439 [Candidatus Endolissoclinum faulkneri L2]|uniref:Uncharacterized protein n=1 Tax=Candidatus Endolissoclinum faulkneri L2 TaxID=1193729 RepID=K7Z632_9PROT|nr:hypothetical protein A1OE_1439 [Candidatus Endolissoclinum faulkneri L2]
MTAPFTNFGCLDIGTGLDLNQREQRSTSISSSCFKKRTAASQVANGVSYPFAERFAPRATIIIINSKFKP